MLKKTPKRTKKTGKVILFPIFFKELIINKPLSDCLPKYSKRSKPYNFYKTLWIVILMNKFEVIRGIKAAIERTSGAATISNYLY